MSKTNKSSTKGESLVWFSSLGLSTGLIMTTGILFLIVLEGVMVFWPKDVVKVTMKTESLDNNKISFAGEVTLERQRRYDYLESNEQGKKISKTEYINETQFYVANRDLYEDSFKFVDDRNIAKREFPKEIMMIERAQNSRALLFPKQLQYEGKNLPADHEDFISILDQRLERAQGVRKKIQKLSSGPIAQLSIEIKRLTVKSYPLRQKLILNKKTNKLIDQYSDLREELTQSLPGYSSLSQEELDLRKPEKFQIKQILLLKNLRAKIIQAAPELTETMMSLVEQERKIDLFSIQAQQKLDEIEILKTQLNIDNLQCEDINGLKQNITLGNLVHYYFPNKLGTTGKIALFFKNIASFFWEDPREANTEGGVFPAIVGTVIMTLLMCILVTPLGVIAAIYLHEYAHNGPIVKMVRVAINNLAGVPSIVFGAFGLGFFIYLAGGSIDKLFFNDWVESGEGAVFGTGGMLWASLTLALMTLPVVIVAAEEALASVPRGMREGAYGCGASKWQMIKSVVLPASAPGILTGMILAMARGAGEVAPLMLVGVIKVASSLPIDNLYPYIHLDQKFMHLGFHIYDLGFQSPDSEAAKPMVFATTLLLIGIVGSMNLICVFIRQKLKKKYATGAF
jgi:phosphate transport system permease protein